MGATTEAAAPTDLAYRQATTACLTAIVLMQIVTVHICRGRTASAFSPALHGNRLISAGIAIELVMIVVIDYTTMGNAVFGTAPIPVSFWLAVVPFGLAMAGLEELRRRVVRDGRRLTYLEGRSGPFSPPQDARSCSGKAI